jgi:heme-degrading monooxygenase HmoA
MIVRSWRGAARPGDVEDYVAHAAGTVFPQLQRLEGFRGAIVMRRAVGGEVEIIVQTFWTSLEDIRAFAGPDISAAVVEPAAQAVLLSFDTVADHYEVAGSVGLEPMVGSAA